MSINKSDRRGEEGLSEGFNLELIIKCKVKCEILPPVSVPVVYVHLDCPEGGREEGGGVRQTEVRTTESVRQKRSGRDRRGRSEFL